MLFLIRKNMSSYSGDTQPGNPDGGWATGSGGDWIGALINTGAMLYDSNQNRKAAARNTNLTIDAQKREAELAYQRSVEMWNKQNMYNDPESQMARFKAAGLNPHLIYGQGNPGNATGTPEYHPANLQYRYEAPAYGAAISSILPTLMGVGTWMQNMRLSQSELEKRKTDTERSRQLIEFLEKRNPKELSKMENALSLYPYQYNMQRVAADQAQGKLFEFESEFRHKYGEDLFADMGSAFTKDKAPIGGMKRLQFLQESSKEKLLEAKSSWADMDITDPQALMMMVMNGVMGLAGQTIRLSTRPGQKAANRRTGEQPSSVRRLHPSRRVQRGD